MSLPIIKVVLWDLDGAHQTSHGDVTGANYQADRHTVAALFPGVELSVEDTWPFVGKHHSVYRKGLIKLGLDKLASQGRHHILSTAPTIEEYTAGLLADFGKIKTQFFKDHPEVLLAREGATEWTHYFYEMGTRQAMASHSPREKVHFALGQIGTINFFSGAYSTDDFENCPHKPKPDVWLKTLEVIAPGVTPSECLVIDDADENIAGAAAVGFNFVHCPDIPRQAESETAQRLKQLAATGKGIVMERNAAFNLKLLKSKFNFVRTPAVHPGINIQPTGQ